MSDSELTVASRGIWIPNEVWENPSLSIQEKALLARIHSFEECFASNQYLADFLGLSVTRTKELITSLCRSGYLHREEERKGRMTVKRILSVDKAKYFGVDGHGPENRPTPAGKPSQGEPESRHHSYKELVKENSNNSSGTSADAPCSECDGDGYEIGLDTLSGGFIKYRCEHCNGTGKEPNTDQPSKPENVAPAKPKKQPYTEDDMKFCQWMFKGIQRINPNHKEPNWIQWAKTCRLMREADKRELSEMTKVYQWVNHDSFWSTNILSMDKFRKQYDALLIKMNAANRPNMSYAGKPQSPYDDSSDFRDIMGDML